jgi:hypothetical protein
VDQGDPPRRRPPPDPYVRVEPYVPARIQPDPERDARRAAYRERERRRVGRAFDSYMQDLYGDLFEERYGVRPPAGSGDHEGDS